MIAKRMQPLVEGNSAIRAMFEEGTAMKKEFGADKVYDFSLGNPNVPAPEKVKETIIDLLENEESTVLHGYMNNAGFPEVRKAISDHLNRLHGTAFGERNILMTVGAASGLNVVFKTLLDPGDEVLVFAPYFVEYGNYVGNYDGKLVAVPSEPETFQPDVEAMRAKINEKTKAVIVNSPHNPTGVVYREDMIIKLAEMLKEKAEEIGHPIFLISDEPYRELAYDGVEVPYLTKYYANTIVGYSFSKSLSLPGERIGYLVIPDELEDSVNVIAAATIANRILGSVNAPSLMQKVIERCLDCKVDVEYYDRNRKTLYEGLESCGLTCVKPEGAFYLWVKSPVEDEKAFVNEGKKHHILMVPGSSFGWKGYVRLAYCVAYETIVNSLPAFAELMKAYQN